MQKKMSNVQKADFISALVSKALKEGSAAMKKHISTILE